MNKKQKHKGAAKRSKKFYNSLLNITSLLALVAFTTIFYFLILISVNYKSFPFVTEIIEDGINRSLPGNTRVAISKSYLKFSSMYKIRVKFDDIKFITIDKTGDKKEFILPKIEADFHILNLIIRRATPSKVKIIGPEITIDKRRHKDSKIAIKGIGEERLNAKEYLKQMSGVFLSLTNSDVAIKAFAISDAKILFQNQFGNKTILVKKAEIKTSFSNGALKLITNNVISFDEKSPDLLINGDCNFKRLEGLECNAGLSNFSLKSFSTFHKKLQPLKQINTLLSGNLNLLIDENHSISELLFSFNANKGDFNYPQFFSSKLNFQNFSIAGEFNNLLKKFRISNLEINFDKAKLGMFLSINNFANQVKQNMDLQFTINNVAMDRLEKLWPVILGKDDSRKWVLNHINGGSVKDGYAKIKIRKQDGINKLETIDSELIFSGLNLNYDDHFPPITNIDGIAVFTKNNMKIDITSGDVLDSKINIGSVVIPNFNNKNLTLLINAKLSGMAYDTLKHVDYKSAFADKIGDYFNGFSQTILDIKIPLISNLELKDSYISVNSDIKNFNNEYITKDSALLINTTKNIGNNQFLTDIDLTNAQIDLKQFGISKNKGVENHIKTILSFDNKNHLFIDNFNWQQDNDQISRQIIGDLLLKLDPVEISRVNLNNKNFGNNNFVLNYETGINSRYLQIIGQNLDLNPLIKNSSKVDFKQKNYRYNNFEIKLGNLHLANNQNFKNINIDINCRKSVCKNGFIIANLQGNKNAHINILGGKSYSKLEGVIDDISIISKAFDLSNQIIDGEAKIKAKIKTQDNKEVLSGEVKIDSGFTVLKNEVVEKIYNNNVFSKLKEEIANDNRIKFDTLKVEFASNYKEIEIKTLIASSNLMGFTAKGKINLHNKSTELKGLIIPGYAVNKLFGIGKIPVIGRIIVGEEGGGIFAIRYDYIKKKEDKKGDFSINPASAVIPGGIRNIFDLF
jgi:hypothetical protein